MITCLAKQPAGLDHEPGTDRTSWQTISRRANVIKALRGIKSYNGNGLLPQSWDYATAFGHDSAKSCAWMMQANRTGFRLVSSQQFCGRDIPGTSTASATS